MGVPSSTPRRGVSPETWTSWASTPVSTPPPVGVDPAVVGGPGHLPNQGSELAVDLVDGRLQMALRLLWGPSMLHRQSDQGHGHLPPRWRDPT
jgi:hypothetical protein